MIALIALGFFDRLRGSGWFAYSHMVGMLGMGAMTSLMLDVNGWTAIYVVAAVMLGAAPGWGNPLGAAFDGRPMGQDYEWWQVGILCRSTLAALLVRGLMWGALLAPISLLAPLAFAIPFTLAPYLARLLPPGLDRWALMEFTRGAAIAALLVLCR